MTPNDESSVCTNTVYIWRAVVAIVVVVVLLVVLRGNSFCDSCALRFVLLSSNIFISVRGPSLTAGYRNKQASCNPYNQ